MKSSENHTITLNLIPARRGPARARQNGLSSLVPATVEVCTRRKRAISSRQIDGLAALALRSQGTLAIALAHDELIRSAVACALSALLLAEPTAGGGGA